MGGRIAARTGRTLGKLPEWWFSAIGCAPTLSQPLNFEILDKSPVTYQIIERLVRVTKGRRTLVEEEGDFPHFLAPCETWVDLR